MLIFLENGESYTDKKFEKAYGSLWRTVFKSDNVWVQVIIDKSSNELIFLTSDKEDITSFNTDKGQFTGNFIKILQQVCYIIPYMMKQLNLSNLMIISKPHTKKTYDMLFDKNIFKKIGLESVSKTVDESGNSIYTFKKNK